MIFEIRSIPDEKGRARAYLMQLPLKSKEARVTPVDMPTCLAVLDGAAIKAAKGAIEILLGGAGKAEAFLSADKSERIGEIEGVKALVLFLAMNGAKSPERVAQSQDAIMKMDQEDAEYWVAKLRNLPGLPPEKAERVRRSFLDMLEG